MFVSNRDVYVLFLAAIVCGILANVLPKQGFFLQLGEWFEILTYCVIGAILYALYKFMGDKENGGGAKIKHYASKS